MTTDKSARLGRDDPLLQALWSTKAAINAAAGYCVETLVKQANSFNLNVTLASLRQQIANNKNIKI